LKPGYIGVGTGGDEEAAPTFCWAQFYLYFVPPLFRRFK